MNKIVLGTHREQVLCSVHRMDSVGLTFPVRYWPEGPDDIMGLGEGWYNYDSEGDGDGFEPHPFDASPFSYPVIQVYDPGYEEVCLLVFVPDYILGEQEFTIAVKPPTGEMLKNFVNNWEW